MSIDRVTLGTSGVPTAGGEARTGERLREAASSSTSFESALGNVAEASLARESAATAAVEQFVKGGEGTLHETLLAVDRSEISLKYLVSVRNKLLDAYHEIMRMGM